MKKAMNTLLVTCIMIIKLSLLFIILPKASAHVKCSDGETKWMDFLTEDDWR